MKQITQNRFLRILKFSNSAEESYFLESCSIKKKLLIEEQDGKNFFSYVGCNSLTQDEEFVLSFRSESDESDLNFLFWNDRIVFDTGRMIYFLNTELSIKAALEITTPMIGLYVLSNNELLILEEAFMRVANNDGIVLRSELFDLVKRVSIEGNTLKLQTDSGERLIRL